MPTRWTELAAREALRALADQGYQEVRYAVASNPSTPGDVLESLCLTDGRYSVTGAIALSNPSTPPSILSLYVESARQMGDRNKTEAALCQPECSGRPFGVCARRPEESCRGESACVR